MGNGPTITIQTDPDFPGDTLQVRSTSIGGHTEGVCVVAADSTGAHAEVHVSRAALLLALSGLERMD